MTFPSFLVLQCVNIRCWQHVWTLGNTVDGCAADGSLDNMISNLHISLHVFWLNYLLLIKAQHMPSNTYSPPCHKNSFIRFHL